MVDRPHLVLPRLQHELPRKKVRGFGQSPDRVIPSHGAGLEREVDSVIESVKSRDPPRGIDPSLILRVQLDRDSSVDEAEWRRSGLSLLSNDENKTLVLFSSDQELLEFKRRLAAYAQGAPPGQKAASYQQMFSAINSVGEVQPTDRIGRLLKGVGIDSPDKIEDAKEYLLDVELWDIGTAQLNRARMEAIAEFISGASGKVTDQCRFSGLLLMRVKCPGVLVRDLLGFTEIASIDIPPATSLEVSQLLDVPLDDFGDIEPPPPGAPGVVVVDSGVTSAHPLIAPALGEAAAMPRSLGDASDENGHGTMVSGLALYGDVERCIETRSFVPLIQLFSARVTNAENLFDEERLITTQMREAIEYFHESYACRVFCISLGDPRTPYSGGKVSPWASILDSLSRELNVVIVVSAGNYKHLAVDGEDPAAALTGYPAYLLDDAARIIEPATGIVVVTVGALAHRDAVPPGQGVHIQPIAAQGEPSPFTRSGPGLAKSIKPELVEVGGNMAFDSVLGVARNLAELSVVSMRREYIERLFRSDCGTSFAAPRVAHMAAKLLGEFPGASANLLRAFLAASARMPGAAELLLRDLVGDAPTQLCGYGQPSLERAIESGKQRAVMFADEKLEHDQFHVFEVPIPVELLEQKGKRRIGVSLAFDPPVRHTRIDYAGVKMSFRLIRGKSANEVAEAFRSRTQGEDQVDSLLRSPWKCEMHPSSSKREGGTLQSAWFEMRQKPRRDYGDTYFLVVRCERKWAPVEEGPQGYAVVVTVEHSADIDIYQLVRERVRTKLRARERQRAR